MENNLNNQLLFLKIVLFYTNYYSLSLDYRRTYGT